MLNMYPLPRKGGSTVYPCVSVCNQLPEFQSPSPITVGRHCGKPFLSLSHHFFVCFPSAEHTEMIPIYKQNKTPILLLLSAVTALSWMVFTAHSSWGSLLLPYLPTILMADISAFSPIPLIHTCPLTYLNGLSILNIFPAWCLSTLPHRVFNTQMQAASRCLLVPVSDKGDLHALLSGFDFAISKTERHILVVVMGAH